MTFADQAAWNARKTSTVLPDGRVLAFVDTGGSGPALLLLHGYSDTSRSFSLMEPALGGFRLLIPDLAGHGGSEAGPSARVEEFSADIHQLLRTLDIDRPAIVGHSMGAMVGLALAARLESKVRALVTVSGALRPAFPADSAMSRGILALADPISPADPFFDDWHACSRPVDAGFLDHARVEAARMPSSLWQGILKAFETTDLLPAARQVRVPVLCIAGADDPLFGAAHRAAMAAAFPAARQVVLHGHGHNPHWEDPARIAALLHGFLAQTAPSAQPS